MCKVKLNNVFHDLSFYFLRNADNFIINHRIKIYFIVILIIILRLYEYYILNKSKGKYKNIKIHGHRGARGVLPENTLAAFKYENMIADLKKIQISHFSALFQGKKFQLLSNSFILLIIIIKIKIYK